MNKRYIFDLDGTICKTDNMDYDNAIPYYDRIVKINADYYIDDKAINSEDFFKE